MTGNPSVLQHTASYPGHDSVQLGNDEQLPIFHTGNTTLTIGKSNFKLDNVYLIPSMRKNLLSISQFCFDNNVLVLLIPITSTFLISSLTLYFFRAAVGMASTRFLHFHLD